MVLTADARALPTRWHIASGYSNGIPPIDVAPTPRDAQRILRLTLPVHLTATSTETPDLLSRTVAPSCP